MTGITLEFKKGAQTGTDDLGNPIENLISISVDNCLVAPITEPESIREQQAMHQARDQVRVHLPKTFTGDIARSYFAWDGKIFHLDSDSVSFMNENTPGLWNRYLRAEAVGEYSVDDPDAILRFFVTEDSQYHIAPESP